MTQPYSLLKQDGCLHGEVEGVLDDVCVERSNGHELCASEVAAAHRDRTCKVEQGEQRQERVNTRGKPSFAERCGTDSEASAHTQSVHNRFCYVARTMHIDTRAVTLLLLLVVLTTSPHHTLFGGKT